MTTYYRLHDSSRNHEGILDTANWKSMNYSATEAAENDIRYGVSACETIEDLAAYFAQTGIEVGCSPVIIEFEGTEADELDHDADLGAILTWPSSITNIITDTDPEWADFDAALEAAFAA